jgi:hypothetical protein
VVRLILVVLVLGALAPAAWAASRPQVRLVAFSPGQVAGTGFHARERVVVRVTGGRNRLERAVMTSPSGGFVARFTAPLAATGCRQLVIAAVGARGDHAAWKAPPRSCGPPPQPVAP